MDKKNILCFGDSLTWGFNIETFGRFALDERWTGILQHKLGDDYRVIEEGLNGRTTVFNDEFTPFGAYGVGREALPMILNSHSPIDLVILMLGTNDLQPHRGATIKDAARGCGECIRVIMQSLAGPEGSSPKVLLVAPPTLITPGDFMEIVFETDSASKEEITKYYSMVAKTFGVDFLNAAEIVEPCVKDGVHFDVEGNKVLADHIYEKVKQII